MSRSQLPPEQLHAMALSFGDQTAYQVLGGGSLTFEEWDDQASRLARGLSTPGSGPATRWPSTSSRPTPSGGSCPTPPSTVPGRWPSPSIPQLARPEVERMIDHSGTVAAIAQESLLGRIPGRHPGAGGRRPRRSGSARVGTADDPVGPEGDHLV